MADPTVMDTFSRYMADLFDLRRMIAVPTGFQCLFGRPQTNANTIFSPDAELVDIDIVKGKRKISALIPRGGSITKYLGGQADLVADQFYSVSRVYPLAKEEGQINASQLLKRQAGEMSYSPKTRFERMRQMALDIHTENARRMAGLFEVLAAQSILTGKQDAILGTTNAALQYDFQRNSDHIVSGGTAWTGSSATPIEDLDTWAARIEHNGFVKPDFVAMAGDVIAAFIKHADISGLADNRRYELVRIGENNPVPAKFSHMVANGWVFMGKVMTFQGRELWICTYQGDYVNSSNAIVKLLPDGHLLMGSTMARCDRYFGPPELLPMVPMREQLYQAMFGFDPNLVGVPAATDSGSLFDSRMFYTDAYTDPGWTSVTIRTWAAPIFATIHTDAFLTVTDLTT